MLKKTMTYTDYNGVQRTEDFYFHLSEAELLEMETGVDGGLTAMMNKLIATNNVPEVMKIFKDLVLKAYGEKSADGRRFLKVDDRGVPLYIAFSQIPAYSDLYVTLATNADEAAKFMNGIVPAKAEKSNN